MITLYLDFEDAKKLYLAIRYQTWLKFHKMPWLGRLEKSVNRKDKVHKMRMTEKQYNDVYLPWAQSDSWKDENYKLNQNKKEFNIF